MLWRIGQIQSTCRCACGCALEFASTNAHHMGMPSKVDSLCIQSGFKLRVDHVHACPNEHPPPTHWLLVCMLQITKLMVCLCQYALWANSEWLHGTWSWVDRCMCRYIVKSQCGRGSYCGIHVWTWAVLSIHVAQRAVVRCFDYKGLCRYKTIKFPIVM